MNTKLKFDLLKFKFLNNQYLDANNEVLAIQEEKYFIIFLKGLKILLLKRIKELKLEYKELKLENKELKLEYKELKLDITELKLDNTELKNELER